MSVVVSTKGGPFSPVLQMWGFCWKGVVGSETEGTGDGETEPGECQTVRKTDMDVRSGL